MSAAPVLGAMSESRHCMQTGLSIPECSCRPCCEVLLCRQVPKHPPLSIEPPPSPADAICLASEFAERLGISLAELHERARSREVEL